MTVEATHKNIIILLFKLQLLRISPQLKLLWRKISYSQPKIDQYIPSIELKKIPPEKALTLLKKEGYQIDNEQGNTRH
jgi:hypothetical protein